MTQTQEQKRQSQSTAQARGLCASCEHVPTCTYAKDVIRPVLQCDEYAPAATAAHGRARMAQPPAQDSGQSEQPLGLCRTCAGRDTCTFTRPEGGVWRCEEYE